MHQKQLDNTDMTFLICSSSLIALPIWAALFWTKMFMCPRLIEIMYKQLISKFSGKGFHQGANFCSPPWPSFCIHECCRINWNLELPQMSCLCYVTKELRISSPSSNLNTTFVYFNYLCFCGVILPRPHKYSIFHMLSNHFIQNKKITITNDRNVLNWK